MSIALPSPSSASSAPAAAAPPLSVKGPAAFSSTTSYPSAGGDGGDVVHDMSYFSTPALTYEQHHGVAGCTSSAPLSYAVTDIENANGSTFNHITFMDPLASANASCTGGVGTAIRGGGGGITDHPFILGGDVSATCAAYNAFVPPQRMTDEEAASVTAITTVNGSGAVAFLGEASLSAVVGGGPTSTAPDSTDSNSNPSLSGSDSASASVSVAVPAPATTASSAPISASPYTAKQQFGVADFTWRFYIEIMVLLHGEAAPTLQQLRVGAALLSRRFPMWTGQMCLEDASVRYDPKGIKGYMMVVADELTPPREDERRDTDADADAPATTTTIPYSIADFKSGDLSAAAFTPRVPYHREWFEVEPDLHVAQSKVEHQKQSESDYSFFAGSCPYLSCPAIVKYTPLTDGCVIGFSIHHYVVDAHGVGLIAKVLSAMTRYGIVAGITQLAEVWGLDEAVISAIDIGVEVSVDRYLVQWGRSDGDSDGLSSIAVDIIPNGRENNTSISSSSNNNGSCSSASASTASTAAAFPAVYTKDTPCPTLTPPAFRFAEEADHLLLFRGVETGNAPTFTMHFTAAEALELKQSAQERATRHGYKSWISTRDALAGHAYTLHFAASHLVNLKEKIEEDFERPILMSTSINCRRHLGVPNAYCGNVAFSSQYYGCARDYLYGVGAPVMVRESVTPFTPTIAKEVLRWTADVCESDVNKFNKHMEMTWSQAFEKGFCDVAWTDWTRMGWDECHFTPQGVTALQQYREALQKQARSNKGKGKDISSIADSTSSSSSSNASDANYMYSSTTTTTTPIPPIQYSSYLIPLPGHVKLLDDLTAAEEGGIKVVLYTGKRQAEHLREGGALHKRLHDTTWLAEEHLV